MPDKDREKKLAYWRDYYQQHREEKRAYSHNRYIINREKILNYMKKYYSKNTEQIKEYKKKYHKLHPETNRNWRLKSEYGMDIEEFNQMLGFQNGLCAICGKEMTETGKSRGMGMVIDHDHKTGAVRGIVHGSCNHILGYAKDDIDILKKAIKYLEVKCQS